MDFILKHVHKKEIILCLSIFAIALIIVGASFLIKSIFNAETMGATGEKILDPQNYIGKYIKYTPEEGTYSEITNSKTYTGTDANSNDFKTDPNINWRIWGIDEEKITIIADKPISVGGYKNLGGLSLANCNGYNNAVKILNDICATCYGNESLGAVSRSLNISDIEKVLEIGVWRPERYRNKEIEAKNNVTRKEYSANKCYPYIYGKEIGSIVDGIEKENGIKKNEQEELYSGKENYIKPKNSINPMQTAWENSKFSEKNFKNPNYYNLIFKEDIKGNENLMSYYLASRAVDLAENHVNYDIFEINMGKGVKTNTLFNSRGGSMEYWDRIRPVVEIPVENIKIDKAHDGMSKDSALIIEKK